jgi:abequosyltransferase
MENFLLSFCIPTYKRPHLLLKAINSIVHSSESFLHAIQIVIADDSTDHTNEWVIEETRTRIKNLKYIKNATNLGIDGNILNAVDSSDGEFVWILGEDDLVSPDAVKTFFEVPNREEYGFICSNYSYVDSEQEKILKKNVIGIFDDKKVSSLELLENYAWSFGFIGACIVNKKAWQVVDSSKYKGTFFAHVGTILEAVKSKSIFIISIPLILNRAGDSTVTTWGAEYTFEVTTGWMELMRRLSSVYPQISCDQACQQFEQKIGVNSLYFLFSKRADGVYTKDIYNRFYKQSKRGYHYHLIALFIAFLSPKTCQRINTLRRKIQSIVL